jgi:hypothetical protein
MSDELKELLRINGEIIWVYLSKSIKQDPEEEDKKDIAYNPIPIRALVTDLTSASVQWKMPGISETQGKELVLNKKYKNTIEQAYKMTIDSDTYVGWKDSQGRTQIREESGYIRLYIYRK